MNLRRRWRGSVTTAGSLRVPVSQGKGTCGTQCSESDGEDRRIERLGELDRDQDYGR